MNSLWRLMRVSESTMRRAISFYVMAVALQLVVVTLMLALSYGDIRGSKSFYEYVLYIYITMPSTLLTILAYAGGITALGVVLRGLGWKITHDSGEQ